MFQDDSVKSPYIETEEDQPRILIKPIKMGGSANRESIRSRKNGSPLAKSSRLSSAPSQDRYASSSPDQKSRASPIFSPKLLNDLTRQYDRSVNDSNKEACAHKFENLMQESPTYSFRDSVQNMIARYSMD